MSILMVPDQDSATMCYPIFDLGSEIGRLPPLLLDTARMEGDADVLAHGAVCRDNLDVDMPREQPRWTQCGPPDSTGEHESWTVLIGTGHRNRDVPRALHLNHEPIVVN
jgi:hypothetical protein